MKVEIELIKTPDMKWGAWKVTYGEKYADRLSYEEMLGLVAAITMPDERRSLEWLKTEEQHQEYNKRTRKIIDVIDRKIVFDE